MILKTSLHPHQIKGVEKLSKIKIAACYCEMGTGKTRMALELINQRLEAGKVNHVLWLCPCSIKSTIEAEINKHVDGDMPITIAGIESLSSSDRLYCDLLQLVTNKNVYLIVDESNLVKNFFAIRSMRITEIAKLCQYKLILNGTPISKNEKDLFAQWYILDWRILGYQSFWSFARNHLEYDEKVRGKVRRVLNVDYLVRKIAPYTYQVKKEECLSLPDKSYTTSYFSMTDEQAEHYAEVKDTFLMLVDELRPSTIYRLFTACQHVVSGNRVVSDYYKPIKTVPMFKPDDNPRIHDLQGLISESDAEKVIIWCKYTREIKDIENILISEYGTGSAVTFYGEIPKRKRAEAIHKFENSSRFFVANKTCAGYGLNLQFCNNVIYYSHDWDWATRAQSEDRVHRMGQDHTVHIVDMCCYDSIDSRILKCLYRKERMVDSFKSWIAAMKDKSELRKWIDGGEIGGEDIQQQKCL